MRFSCQQRLVLIDLLREVLDERPNLILETFIDLVLRSADAEHVRRQPRAAIVLENLQYLFALAKGVQEDGHRADIERVSTQPEQMAGDAVQLRHDDADVLRARRRRDAEHLLDGFAVSETIGNRRDVVHAIERRNKLAVGLMLRQVSQRRDAGIR